MRPGISQALIEVALRRVHGADLLPLLAYVERLTAALRDGRESDGGAYLAILRRDDASLAFKTAVGLVHLGWRSAWMSRDAALESAFSDELASYRVQIERLMEVAAGSSSGSIRDALVSRRTNALPMPELTDGRFIQHAHEAILGRGCQPHELLRWRARLSGNEVTREGLLAALQLELAGVVEQDAARRTEASASFHIMGTGERITLADWKTRAGALASAGAAESEGTVYPQRFHIKSPPRVLVSALTSLYKGGEYIERFMENIVSQTCFRDHAELIVVDADSPDGERAVIERYIRALPNIKYLRIDRRIGIYEAWNIAIEAAAGDYLTCTNVDDLRRSDSLEQQVAVLENLPFVDIVYQDFYYTFDPTLAFEQVAAFGYKSDLPLVTPQGLMGCNPPHNAPMWRRRLHDELGLFDTSFESAGDYDFWMRCVIAGKTFFKMNDAHVAYFQNPRGLSTRPDTKGHAETRAVHKRYGRQLVSDNLVMPLDAFRAQHMPGAREPGGIAREDRHAQVHLALIETAVAAKRGATR